MERKYIMQFKEKKVIINFWYGIEFVETPAVIIGEYKNKKRKDTLGEGVIMYAFDKLIPVPYVDVMFFKPYIKVIQCTNENVGNAIKN